MTGQARSITTTRSRAQHAQAIRRSVEIVGRGTVKATGLPIYGATSASEPNRLHLIVWSPTAHEWECDCARWAYHRQCRHVDALNERLATERVSLTAKGRAVLAAQRAGHDCATAPRRGPHPFSLLKS